MSKFLLAAVMTAALAPTAFAAKKTDKGTAKEVHCAVMPSHKVNVAEATKKHMFADYKGNRYFFCCGGCPAEFKKDPAKFAKADHIPTPKEATK